jgi:hypothetical protein
MMTARNDSIEEFLLMSEREDDGMSFDCPFERASACVELAALPRLPRTGSAAALGYRKSHARRWTQENRTNRAQNPALLLEPAITGHHDSADRTSDRVRTDGRQLSARPTLLGRSYRVIGA